MRYEEVFGDQKRFNEQNNELAEVMLWHDFLGPNFVSLKELSRMNSEGSIPHGSVVLAMRRIIHTPTWTVADQKAGRLPEVGSKAVSVHDFCVVDILAVRNRCIVVCNSAIDDSRPCVFTIDNFMACYKPIETPEEKAARLREEWCSNALDSASILSEMQKYELKRLGGYIEDIYDALLSGDLPVPVKDGE